MPFVAPLLHTSPCRTSRSTDGARRRLNTPRHGASRKRMRACLHGPDSEDTTPSAVTNRGVDERIPPDPIEDPPPKSPASPESPFDAAQRFVEAFADAIYKPLASCSVLSRRWVQHGDSLILAPEGTPKAVIHFIGGAFVGAAPHVAYRTFLERLVARNYTVVTTPYELSLDYMGVVADLAQSWSSVRRTLPPGVPLIGVGHSAGALFHAIGASLYPDAFDGVQANVLVSYNNKRAADAIPLYGAVFAPAFAAATSAEQQLPVEVRSFLTSLPSSLEDTVAGSPLTPDRVRNNFLPTLRESRRIVGQLAPLIREIGTPIDGEEGGGSGGPEFYPPPDEVRSSIEALYRVPHSLVVRFENDAIDESQLLEEMLQARAKKSGNSIFVTSTNLPGSHITPCTQDLPIDDVVLGVAGVAAQIVTDAVGGREMDRLIGVLDEWVECVIAKL